MNQYQLALIDKPSHTPEHCVVCGARRAAEHHVVLRSAGGKDGPRLSLCIPCHGKAHSYMLHFRYTSQWEYLLTDAPLKYDKAVALEGWKPLR